MNDILSTLPHLLILGGPTGVGKTAVAIELCDLLNGEIISADSMLIYRGCDIATAKPTREEQTRAPHHLIDILKPSQRYSAAEWAADARNVMQDLQRRGKQPLIVGGTGFYLRALLEPETLATAPPNPALRAEMEALLNAQGVQAVWEHLQQLDPTAAARLHPNDTFRVIRACEVAIWEQENTEQAFTEKKVNLPGLRQQIPTFTAIGLTMPRELLYPRLEKRIDTMIESGFMDELRGLRDTYGAEAPALQGVGYKQMLPALDDPALFDAGVELWKRDTRRYAKRQMTWFRHQLAMEWKILDEGYSPRQVAQEIADEWWEVSGVTVNRQSL